jgi:hypothetical protein
LFHTRAAICSRSLGKRLLHFVIGGAGNFHGDIGRHNTALDGGEETLFAVFE